MPHALASGRTGARILNVKASTPRRFSQQEIDDLAKGVQEARRPNTKLAIGTHMKKFQVRLDGWHASASERFLHV